jgi:phage terminase large subunit
MADIVSILSERQARLLKMREDTRYLEAAWVHYSANPVDFINDWMITYDPRLQPSMLPFLLFPKQEEYIRWLYARYKGKEDGLVEKSRDMGVTWLCCAFAVWMWLFVRGCSISFGSRKEDLVDRVGDPDSIFEKMRIILDNLPAEFLPAGFEIKTHATHMKILNPENGSNVKGEAGDNIGRGGRSSIYFKDESAFYERPDRIDAALSMNSDVKIDVSTPNGNGNPFYRKRHGGKIPVFTFHWHDDPRKDDNWYRKQKEMLDPVIVAQEIDINYDASVSNVLIDSNLVREAMEQRGSDIYGEKPNDAPVILGVDVARFGDDRTALCLRQGREVHWFKIYNKLDITQTAGEVINVIRETHVDAVFVDVVGVGAGVYDILNGKYDGIYAVNAGSTPHETGKYYNHRAEMWGRMREWLKDGPVVLPNNSDLMTDLCSLRYSFNADGKLVLEKKEDAKKRGVRSPDIGDALALTFSEYVVASDYEDSPNSRYANDTRDSRTGY